MASGQADLAGLEAGYGPVDRMVHRIAFATASVQVGLCDLEDRMFADRLAEVEAGPPVFVTALPRAGTTLLLELLNALPEFAAHTYRDMPFVLCPLFWNRISGGFQRSAEARERAHGDGMQVSFDSAEAFEEMIWKVFWPDQYRGDRIVPWDALGDPEFQEFFANHMRKIIALRRPGAGSGRNPGRYLSKNNLNIARLPGLAGLLPEAAFLVPFRTPLQHAASLLRQHERFLRLHAEDAFAKTYMAAIGHYDFGANLRPVDFGGWFDRRDSPSDRTLAFWLEYWIACYGRLFETADGSLHLISYDRLVARPAPALEAIAGLLEVSDPAAFCAQASRISASKPREPDLDGIDPALLQEAERLEARLLDASLV